MKPSLSTVNGVGGVDPLRISIFVKNHEDFFAGRKTPPKDLKAP